jgi:hypothetical protein
MYRYAYVAKYGNNQRIPKNLKNKNIPKLNSNTFVSIIWIIINKFMLYSIMSMNIIILKNIQTLFEKNKLMLIKYSQR